MNTVQRTCRVDIFDDDERHRWQALRETMRAARTDVRELPDGYAVRFGAQPALFAQVAEWITLERRCCAFLDFGLDWSGAEGVRLRLTGGPGVKEFLREARA
jgi:hypothetical protein